LVRTKEKIKRGRRHIDRGTGAILGKRKAKGVDKRGMVVKEGKTIGVSVRGFD